MAGHGVRSLQQTKHNIFVLGTYYIMGLRHFRTEIYFMNLMYLKYIYIYIYIYIYNLWLIICWDLMFNFVMFLICNAFRDYIF